MTRVDQWVWAVRLSPSRSQATAGAKAGHIRINGERAKPSQSVVVGDHVRVLTPGGEKLVTVEKLIVKRVGAPQAAECYTDHTPPPPPKEERVVIGVRERGAGRPTKRDRRELDRLQGRAP